MAEADQTAVAFTGGMKAVPPPDFSSADATIKRVQDFDNLTQRIKDVKGIDTPEKRLTIANDLRAVQPETSVLKGIAATLMGNKEAGRLLASQGRITSKVIYDENGLPALVKTAENNPNLPVDAFDINENRPIPLQEYANRKFGQYDSYANTPAGLSKKLEIESRKPEYEKERAVVYTKNAAAQTLLDLNAKQKADYELLEPKGLSNELQNLLASYSNATAGYTTSISDAINTMKQASQDKSSKDASIKSGKLKKALGFLSGEAGISKEKIESMGSAELDQLYNTLNSGQNIDAKFSQDKKTAFEGAWAKNLSNEDKLVLENVFQRAQQIARLEADSSVYGNLKIAPTQFNPEILKQAGSAVLQSVVGQFNAEATMAYANWFDEQKFPEGQLPSPGELQSAFMRTGEYKKIKEKYGQMADQVETKSKKIAAEIQSKEPSKPSAQIGGIAVAPQSTSEISKEKKESKNTATPPKPKSEDRVNSLVNQILKKF